MTQRAAADPNVVWFLHQPLMSGLKPSCLNQDQSIFKYVCLAGLTCDAHRRGVWSDKGLGKDVTSAKAFMSRSSSVKRNQGFYVESLGCNSLLFHDSDFMSMRKRRFLVEWVTWA